jgi:hypothetical protein
MMIGIKNYYLGTPFPWYEYMRMILSRFPEEIEIKYNLKALAIDSWVYIEIRKGVYGLKKKHYCPINYHRSDWHHFATIPVATHRAFFLIVHDITVKYIGKQHAAHLSDAILRSYELTSDWEGKLYAGITLKWYYKNRTCDIFMPGYVSNVLSKFQHDTPTHPQQTPYRYAMPVYGATPSMQRRIKHLLSRQNSFSIYKE